MKKFFKLIFYKMKELARKLADIFKRASEEIEDLIEDEKDKDNPSRPTEPEESKDFRIDSNGIRLFPEDLDLSYPNIKKGVVPGREIEMDPNDPGEPEEWEKILSPIKGDNWNYLRESIRNSRSVYIGPGVYHVDVIPIISKGGDMSNFDEMIRPDNCYIKFD